MLPSEKLPTGAEIVERSIEHIGGRQKLAKVRNRLTKATMQMKMFGKSINGSMIAYQARPNKYYIKSQFPGLYTVEQGCNGEVVWEVNSMSGAASSLLGCI